MINRLLKSFQEGGESKQRPMASTAKSNVDYLFNENKTKAKVIHLEKERQSESKSKKKKDKKHKKSKKKTVEKSSDQQNE